MTTKKVSQMTELTNLGSLDDKFTYVVTETPQGNTYNKMSLETLSRDISDASIPDGIDIDYTNSNMVQWGAAIKLSPSSVWKNKNLTLPCDCFVWGGTWNSDGWGKPKVAVDGIEDIGNGVWWNGFYCSKGTVLSTKTNYDSPYVCLAPLVYGNIDSDKCVVRKNMTPKELSVYIQNNMGTGQIFQAIDGKSSGVFGLRDGTWYRFTSTSADTNTYYKFGVRARVNDLKYVLLTCPSTYSNYLKYKDGKQVSLEKKTISSANSTSVSKIFSTTNDADHRLKWSDFNVINLTVLDFAPDTDIPES